MNNIGSSVGFLTSEIMTETVSIAFSRFLIHLKEKEGANILKNKVV